MSQDKRASSSSQNSTDKEALEDPTVVPVLNNEKTSASTAVGDEHILTGYKLVAAFAAMLLTMIMVGITQSILSTAVPSIASDFESFSSIGWIFNSFYITQAGFLLLYGQLLTVFPNKYIYMFAVSLFMLGSLISGVAQNLTTLVAGRAITGAGASGTFISVISVLTTSTLLKDRSLFFSVITGAFALSSIISPVIGGLFTDRVIWRWCFYISLPLGGASLIGIFFVIDAIEPLATSSSSRWKRLLAIDWIGAILVLAWVLCLQLALGWGGQSKPWNDPSVIAMFCMVGVILIIYIAWSWWRGPAALTPLSLFRNRTQIGSCLQAFFVYIAFIFIDLFIPLWFQSVRGDTATKSAVHVIAYELCVATSSTISGVIVKRTGRYWPILLLSPLIVVAGTSLLSTYSEFLPLSKLIGYQILTGFGVGPLVQNQYVSIQAEYAHTPQRIQPATAVIVFTQLIGGVIGIALSNSIFATRLAIELGKAMLPDDILQMVSQQSDAIWQPDFDPTIRAEVVHAYAKALSPVFLIGAAVGALACLSTFLIRNHDLRKRSDPSGGW